MARFKVHGRKRRCCKTRSQSNHEVSNDNVESGDETDDESEDVKPMVISQDQYVSLFGDSENEESAFIGFEKDEIKTEANKEQLQEEKENVILKNTASSNPCNINIKSENEASESSPNISIITPKRVRKKINYRLSIGRKSSIIDDPYKKTYFSHRSTESVSPEQKNTINDKQQITESGKPQKTASAAAAKVILNKAHKVKQMKIQLNPLKITIRKEESLGRSKRTQKSTYRSDFIYEVPGRNKRKHEEIKTPPPVPCKSTIKKELKSEKCGNAEKEFKKTKFMPGIRSDSSPYKKKARIKYASSPEKVASIEKKKVKIKNSSPQKNYSVATVEDITITKTPTKNEPVDDNVNDFEPTNTYKNLSAEKITASRRDLSELKSLFYAIDDSQNDENSSLANSNNTITKHTENAADNKTDGQRQVLQTETNNIQQGYSGDNTSNVISRESVAENPCKDNFIKIPSNKDSTRNPSYENNTKSTGVGNVFVYKHTNKNSYLRMKAVKVNSEVRYVDLNNRLVTFCRECENCRKKEDCGKCKHCRYSCVTQRVLPCWERRCLNPTFGKIIQVKKKKNNGNDGAEQTTKDVEMIWKRTRTKQIEKSKEKTEKHEKLELSFVPDNQINKTMEKSGGEEPLQFRVPLHGKLEYRGKEITSPSGRSTVFTGLSPIKPKLRSTMNELMKHSECSNLALPRIHYGPETLVKLSWPNDGHEDNAWLSGHHLCMSSDLDFSSFSFCFLCGSSGKGKMITCQYCCEVFHPFCLDVAPVDKLNWACDRCKRCTVCGFKENLLMCDKCHDCYHAECLGPFYQRDTEGIDETWVCGKCVECTKCGRRTAGNTKNSRWMFNFSMCEECGTNWQRKNYCPVCEVLYKEDDDSLKMMLCSRCERWIHMECEQILLDDYEILADLPDSIPYICKLCSGNDKLESTWFKEIRDELNSGFLKIYYDLISHRDYKHFKKSLSVDSADESDTNQSSTASCFDAFDEFFKKIEFRYLTGVHAFHACGMQALENLNRTLKSMNTFDISLGVVIIDADTLIEFFDKSVKVLFPWFNVETTSESSSNMNKGEFEVKEEERDQEETMDATTILENTDGNPEKTETTTVKGLPINEDGFTNDHCYPKSTKNLPIVPLKYKNFEKESKKDERRCLFCNKFGDSEEMSAGRLLYCGLDDWVHINCALWSAEVYEDDSGRLKNVYDAIKRGNKLKCDACNSWGASIGCCFLKCSRSYHFLCAMESKVVFQDDKKIFCKDHNAKANKSLILTSKELAVPRRVVVDLVRFKSTKKVQRGLNPNCIRVVCGGLRLQALGSLSEESDQKYSLVPFGYRVTKIFWSTKDPRVRCKYMCEIQLIQKEKKDSNKKEETLEQFDEQNLTYCHNHLEWERLLHSTECFCDAEHVKETQASNLSMATTTSTGLRGVKRKLYPQSCEKCLKNLKYTFLEHQKIKPLIAATLPPPKSDEKTQEDHNFFTLPSKQQEQTKQQQKKQQKPLNSDKSKSKSKSKIRSAIIATGDGCEIAYSAALSPAKIASKSSVAVASVTAAYTRSIKDLREKGYSSFEQYQMYRHVLENSPMGLTMLTTASNKTSKEQPLNTNTSASSLVSLVSVNKRTVESGAKAIRTNVSNFGQNAVVNPKSQKYLGSKHGKYAPSLDRIQTNTGRPSSILIQESTKTKKRRSLSPLEQQHKSAMDIVKKVIDESYFSNVLASPSLTTSELLNRNTHSSQTVSNIVPNYHLVQSVQNTVIPSTHSLPSPSNVTTQSLVNGNGCYAISQNPCLNTVSQTDSNIIIENNKHISNSLASLLTKLPKVSSGSCIKENVLLHASRLLNLRNITTEDQKMHSELINLKNNVQPSPTLNLSSKLNNSENSVQLDTSSNSSQKQQQITTAPASLMTVKPTQQKWQPTLKFQPHLFRQKPKNSQPITPNNHMEQRQQNSRTPDLSKQRENSTLIISKERQNLTPEVSKQHQNLTSNALFERNNVTPGEQHLASEVLKRGPNSMSVFSVSSDSISYPVNSLYKITPTVLQIHGPNSVSSVPVCMTSKVFATNNSSKHIQNTSQKPPSRHSIHSAQILQHELLAKKKNLYENSSQNNMQPSLSTQILNSLGNNVSIAVQPSVLSEQHITTSTAASFINRTTEGMTITKPTTMITNTEHQKAPPVSTSSNNLSLKQELLLCQLREYLKKNPNIVQFAGNAESQLGNTPVVNLCHRKQNNELIYYSALLPEHLWMELVNSGIAQKDITKFLQERSPEQSKNSPKQINTEEEKSICDPHRHHTSRNGLISFDVTKTLVTSQQNTRITLSPFNPHTSVVSLVSSVKDLQDSRRAQSVYPILTTSQLQQKQKQSILQNTIRPVHKEQTATKYSRIAPKPNPCVQIIPCVVTLPQYVLSTNQTMVITNAMGIQRPTEQQVMKPSVKLLSDMKRPPVQISMSPRKLLLQETLSPDKMKSLDIAHTGAFTSYKSILSSRNSTDPLPAAVNNTSHTSPPVLHSVSPLKRKKRIKMATVDETVPLRATKIEKFKNLIKKNENTLQTPSTKCSAVSPQNTSNHVQKSSTYTNNTEIDVCGLDVNLACDQFMGSDEFIDDGKINQGNVMLTYQMKAKENHKHKKQRRDYGAMLDRFLEEKRLQQKTEEQTKLKFVISNDDGWREESLSLQEIWKKLIEKLNEVRSEQKLPTFPIDVNEAYDFIGLSRDFVAYLVEQLPGGDKCRTYKFQHHLPCVGDDDQALPENPSGCARGEVAIQTAERDMFAWLSSAYRNPPKPGDEIVTEDIGGQDLPTAMKYRFLKNTAKDHVGVYRSAIQGRGLFCKKTIETGDMIIEYSGEKIRSVLTDMREDYYEKKGYGCYMFRIDHMDVVDATMKGNAARFINHSCDPNCYSKVISVDGCKKIIIYALRRITVGEELTYDYKFAPEDDKLPCYCGSKKCRKYLN